MTYEQIERSLERRTDSLDAKYMNGQLGEAEYHAECRRLDRWFDEQMATLKGRTE